MIRFEPVNPDIMDDDLLRCCEAVRRTSSIRHLPKLFFQDAIRMFYARYEMRNIVLTDAEA